MEDYYFDVPEGMDLMVHHRSQSLDDSETRRDDTLDMVTVCQTVSCVTRIGPDEFSDTSGTETAVVNGQDIDDFNQWAGSSDDEDFFVCNAGSSVDISLSMSEQEELINTEVESVVDFDSDDSVMVMIPIRALWRSWNGTLGTKCVLWTFRMRQVHFRRIRLWSVCWLDLVTISPMQRGR